MHAQYLSLIPFEEALRREESAFAQVAAGGAGQVLGFESEPVITLGVRGVDADVRWSPEILAAKKFRVLRLDRGGQATLHHPGQLVIFPILNVKEIGARAWVDFLLRITRETLADFGSEVHCLAGKPGLFSESGKMVSIGVRIRQGISTHGLAINICGDLADFASIHPCGEPGAPMDRLGRGHRPEEVFPAWVDKFRAAHALE